MGTQTQLWCISENDAAKCLRTDSLSRQLPCGGREIAKLPQFTTALCLEPLQ
jgi:hypothetical protein